MVNIETGEILQDQEGNPLSLSHMSKSWYSEQGAKNNAFSVVKRCKMLFDFPNDARFRPKFITLTFANIQESWKAEKAIQKFLNALRTWAKRQGVGMLAYFWTSEVQARGALHYHILVLGAPFIRKEQAAKWWKYGFIDMRAVDDMGRAFKYLAKYLWKWGKSAAEPDALPDWWFLFSAYEKRRYGFSKFFTLPPLDRLPRWVRDSIKEGGLTALVCKASRPAGGGWDVKFNFDGVEGVAHFASPFKVMEFQS
jgi:hypothetical protein